MLNGFEFSQIVKFLGNKAHFNNRTQKQDIKWLRELLLGCQIPRIAVVCKRLK